MKRLIASIFTTALCLTACAAGLASDQNEYPTLMTTQADLSSSIIISKAYTAAGGKTWTRPKSLSMDGYAVFYKDGIGTKNEPNSRVGKNTRIVRVVAADQIKGRMSLREVSRISGMPLDALYEALDLAADQDPDAVLRDLTQQIPGFETSLVREVVADYQSQH